MKPYFRGPFCTQDVREGLVVAFLRYITHVCNVSFRSLCRRHFVSDDISCKYVQHRTRFHKELFLQLGIL